MSYRNAWGILISVITIGLGAGQSFADVAAKQTNQTNAAAGQCSLLKRATCSAQGGSAETRSSQCVCVFYDYVPRQVANADDGDVGLVPILPGNNKGNALVRLVLGEAGQLHRHAVMFHNDGKKTRHDTMYFSDAEDGSTSDAGGDYIDVITPVIGKVRLNANELRNGTPGAITQTIDKTLARGRLETTGLVLKPYKMTLINPTTGMPYSFEPNRARFEDAVATAKSTLAYYKLSDYTQQTSMSLTYFGTRTGNQRGSHCSGFIASAFAAQGFTISTVFYSQSLRAGLAQSLYSATRQMVKDKTGFWQDLLLGLTLHWNAATNIANQITNCFAGLGCGNLDDTWRTDIGTGRANSPDNLLPRSFRLYGYRSYDWDGTDIDPQDTFSNANGTNTTPFQRVEAQVMAGGYWTERVETSW